MKIRVIIMKNDYIKGFVPREIERNIKEWIDSKEVLVIRGPRQSGKTTLLYMIMGMLKERKVDKKRINLITLEDDFEKEKFEKNPKEYISYYIGNDEGRYFFLFDEVQYIKNAGKLLKLLYDSFDNIKIIITGSSSLDLNQIASYLVGRAIFFELYPFSFEEFLKAKDVKAYEYSKKNKFDIKAKKIPSTLFVDKLNFYLREYLTYGGYPRVVLEEDYEKKKILLKNLYLTYIEKDIVKVYGIKYKQRVSELVKHLAALNSLIINYNEICSITGFYFKELKEVMGILENTYIIKVINPFHRNLVTELKKNPKVYFMDSGLRNFIANRFDFSDEELGRLLENYVLGKFREEKVNYWRTTAKAEVDFVLSDKVIPIEVKIKPKITRSLRSFITEYKPRIAVLVNMDRSYKEKIENTDIFVIPACLL